jgi:saccharopine dehydrogenase-like NADP-dependent oxidoreductase
VILSFPDRSDGVLVLGAGLVAPPLVRYLLAHTDLSITIAALEFRPELRRLSSSSRVTLAVLDGAEDEHEFSHFVSRSAAVVSLLPPSLHLPAVQLCIAHRRPLVTTSYVSDEISALDQAAYDAGVLVLKECGFHPGINHMLAMRVIDRVHGDGCRIAGYDSYAGGLPANDSNDNPWGYKFSWSPRGVLDAALEPATLLENGSEIRIPGGHIFERPRHLTIDPLGKLEAYPNRSATKYRELYGIPDVREMHRCTVRYPGHCETWDAMIRLGLLGKNALLAGSPTYSSMMRELAGGFGADVRTAARRKLGLNAGNCVLDRFEWLGLFDDDPLPSPECSPFEALLARMKERMSFRDGEHDVVILHDVFDVERSDGTRTRTTASLMHRGEMGVESAMATLVGLPAAIAVRFIVEKRIRGSGLMIPTTRSIYQPILEELCRLGVQVCTDS